MGNRRDFLKSIVPAAVVVAAPMPVMAHRSPDEECQFQADRLAEAMVQMHGGRAVVMVDHKAAIAQIVIV